MKITPEDVKHAANLAMLNADAGDLERLTGEMSAVFEYADILNEVDTAGAEPTYHLLGLENVFREDVVTSNYDRDKLLANAPGQYNGCFEVPKVVD